MSEQEQRRTRQRDDAKTKEEAPKKVDKSETTAAIDDLLDEIDSVLEENAEEFVKNYVQKGGE